MSIKISFCIPTYNFGRFIGEALEGIIAQATDEVELVVVDGASADNTQEVIRHYQKLFPRISYFLREKNMGVDRDIDKAVELAKGQYCWLMSADDRPKPGAIKRMLGEIESGYNIYLCNRTECDFSLRPIKDRLFLSRGIGDSVFDLSDNASLAYYLNKSRAMGALFSYCSSLVFNRQNWNDISYDDLLTGTCYAHVYRLFSLINLKACRLKYIREPLIFCRGNNDSFLAQGQVRRLFIDIDGYSLLAGRLFAKDIKARKLFLQVVMRDIKFAYLIKIRSLIDEAGVWEEAKTRLSGYGYSAAALGLAGTLGSLKTFVKIFFNIRGKIKNRLFCVYGIRKKICA